MNLTGLTVNVIKGLIVTCGAKSGGTTTGSYSGDVNVIAKNAGVQTGLSIG
jgi:hypothetical protein